MTELTGGMQVQLPRPIVETLEHVIRRRRRAIALKGASIVLAVAVGSLLLMMGADAAVVIFSPAVRWILTCTAAAATLAAGLWFLARPLLRPTNLARTARLVEQRHPELEERLSSAVELLSSRDRQELLGSKELISRLAEEASQQAQEVRPESALKARSLVPYVAAACVAVALLGGLWAMWPGQTLRLIVRAVAPGAKVGTLGSERLVVSPGDTVRMAGETLKVEVVADGDLELAELLRPDEAGVEKRFPMERLGDGNGEVRYSLEVPCGEKSFKYRVLADREILTPYYDVTVTPRPEVAGLKVQYAYPEYTRIEPKAEDPASGDVVGPVGTKATLTAAFNKPMVSLDVSVNGKPVTGKLAEDGRSAVWEIDLIPAGDGQWSLTVADVFGFTSRPVVHRIRAAADAVPVVRLKEPTAPSIRLRPTEHLPVSYEAEEDYGLESAELVVRIDNQADKPVTMPAARPQLRADGLWSGSAALDLAKLNLVGARQVRFQVRVRDTLPKPLRGPQEGLSRECVIDLDAAEQSWAARQAEAWARQIEASLNQAITELTEGKKTLSEVKPKIAAEPLRLSDATGKAVVSVQERAAKADEILRRVAEQEALPNFPWVASQTQAVRSGPVAAIRNAMDTIRTSDAKQEQNDQAKSAEEQTDIAIAWIRKIIEVLKADTERVKRALEIAAKAEVLADEQNRIKEMTKEEEAAETAAVEEFTKQVAEMVLEMQREIAAEAEALARDVAASGLNPGQEHQQAANSTREAATEMGAGNMAKAVPAAKKAAGELGQLKDKLAQAPQHPRRDPLADKAGDLKKRQDSVNAEIDALAKGDPSEALRKMQEDLAERIAKAAEEAKAPFGEASPDERSKQNAKNAGKELSKAADLAKEALMWMGPKDDRPGKHSPPKLLIGKQSPAENGGNPDGGQGTEGGGSNTGAGQSKNPSPPNNNKNESMGGGVNLGKATITADADLTGPAQKGAGSGTILQEGAEEALRRAAGLMQNNPESKGMGGLGGGEGDEEGAPGPDTPGMAQDGSGQPGQAGTQGGTKPARGGGGRGHGRAAARMKQLGLSSDDWLRLPSDLRSEILEAPEGDAPEEYRDLVRRYFQTLARRSNAGTEKK